jgi:hypothetical protein
MLQFPSFLDLSNDILSAPDLIVLLLCWVCGYIQCASGGTVKTVILENLNMQMQYIYRKCVPSTLFIQCDRSDGLNGLWATGRCDAGAGRRIAACALRAGGSITAGSSTPSTSSAFISTATFHNDGLANNKQSTGAQRVHAQALCHCATP